MVFGLAWRLDPPCSSHLSGNPDICIIFHTDLRISGAGSSSGRDRIPVQPSLGVPGLWNIIFVREGIWKLISSCRIFYFGEHVSQSLTVCCMYVVSMYVCMYVYLWRGHSLFKQNYKPPSSPYLLGGSSLQVSSVEIDPRS